MTDFVKRSVKDWSPEDQPREKLLLKGVSALSDAELLAIILGSGNKEETVVELARRILQSTNYDLNQLGKLSVNSLIANFKGIGEAKAVSIVATLELGKRRKARETDTRNKFTNSVDIYNYFHPMLCDLPHEELWALFLNRSNLLIGRFKISQGGVSETVVDGRLIYKEAVMHLASGVILCHNHPSGNPMPSRYDTTVTLEIKKSLGLLGMLLLDHVILTDGKYYSFADEEKI